MKKQVTKRQTLSFYGGARMAILPILIFIIIGASLAIFYKFYAMKGLVFASLVGLLVGFIFARNKGEYWQVVISGLTKFGNAKLIFTFLLIGVFTELLTVGKIGSGFVWLSAELGISGGAFVVFTFLATTVIAMGSGAPIAAIFAVVPIFYPPGIILGAEPAVLLGAMLSGVFFGDALSPSSQVINTTLDTQHDAHTQATADLHDVMKARTPYLIGIAILSAILFYLLGGNGASISPQELSQVAQSANPLGLVMLIPIAILLVVSFFKKDLFLGLSEAILAGLAIGLVTGLFDWSAIVAIGGKPLAITGILTDGMYSMIDIIVSTILLFGMLSVAVTGGFMELACHWLLSKCFIQTPRGANVMILLGIGVINSLLSGCVLPAILLFGDVADHIGQKVHLPAYERTYLLTGAATTITAIIPVNSAFVMGTMTLIDELPITQARAISVSPFAIFGASFYCLFLTVVCVYWALKRPSHAPAHTKALRTAS